MVMFAGICRGGPCDGLQLGAPHRTYKIVFRDRPLAPAEGPATRVEEVVQYRHGFYRFDRGEWHWHEPR